MNAFILYFALLKVADDRLLIELPYVTDASTAIDAVHSNVQRGVAERGYVVRHEFQRNRISHAKVVRITDQATDADLVASPHFTELFMSP